RLVGVYPCSMKDIETAGSLWWLRAAQELHDKRKGGAHVELFLSAVSDEFRPYRESLRELLKRPNVDIHIQEDFIPTEAETLDKLDSYIARCDAIIHLVGDMTGSWAGPATLQALRARYYDLAYRLSPPKAARAPRYANIFSRLLAFAISKHPS